MNLHTYKYAMSKFIIIILIYTYPILQQIQAAKKVDHLPQLGLVNILNLFEVTNYLNAGSYDYVECGALKKDDRKWAMTCSF